MAWLPKRFPAGRPPGSGDSNNFYRKSVYTKELGEPQSIFPRNGSDDVEVLAFPRDFSLIDPAGNGFVLLTNGMSDRRMATPSTAGENIERRAELMWYVREPDSNIISNLKWLAEYPFIDNTWLGFGHRIEMPWSPVSGTDFRIFMFLTPIIAPDKRIAEALTIDDDDVTILCVHLISAAEYEFIKTVGLDPFLDMLDKRHYPTVLDPKRTSYV
ncbi:suppressor of fused domain protein [Mesorhizobium sp. M4B.F.Ca.ET.017.02.2.1]|uniref:suppressor of fused domain protein n=1 Tax=Mesorhizobium sp. M4B.F.Ca.ET.017.02.2.1 TaxID=2496649 RepID=UPI000FCA167F|nr:suppressor of fused domain protein [Mesorhizobium sp. M4B.F.Ca.ET.017.02.2.1]RVD23467.1 suppressor of fused domain protein [Mesorhizobium sp. M4B.F.Ca.ET.017.02.2.1]